MKTSHGLFFALTLTLVSLQAAGNTMAANPADLWLEAIISPRVDAWVASENARSRAALVDTPLYQRLYREGREALLVGGTLPGSTVRNGFVYDIETSRDHPRGVWRRTPIRPMLRGRPEWRALLDFDALAKAESTNWVYQGASCLPPRAVRCIITLSDGGSDSATRREFDLGQGAFVTDGFVAPPAKGSTAWVDANTLAAALAIDPKESTASGYPAAVRLWSRGGSLAASPVLLHAAPSDMRLTLQRLEDADGRGGVFINQEHSFEKRSWWLVRNGRAIRLALPDDATVVAVHSGQLVFGVDTDFDQSPTNRMRAGGIYSVPLDALVRVGALPTISAVLEPGPRQSVAEVESTRNRLVISMLDNLSGVLVTAAWNGRGWARNSVNLPENLNLQLGSVDDRSDTLLVTGEGFLTPKTLFAVNPSSATATTLAASPSAFNAEGMLVERRQATSRDGTLIPYFVVRRADAPMDGSNPTQVFAYGGFQLSLTPFYAGVTGKLWLERGGIYVQASIRGGGEFGPTWHEAAVRERRQTAYDDLIAVAEDLVREGYTRPERMGFQGGSNGGLLAGVMYNQRPDLWGAIVAGGPLLDMLRYDQLLAGASWRSEYGDPSDPAEGAFLRSISPYHNVDPSRPHPTILLMTSTNDDRVHPAHARRFAHRLGEAGLRYLFYEDTEGGHAGASFYDDLARQQALIYTFLSQQLMPEAEAADFPR